MHFICFNDLLLVPFKYEYFNAMFVISIMVVNLHAWSEETLMYTPVKTKNITVELNNGLILKSLVWETDGTLIKKIIIFEAKGD